MGWLGEGGGWLNQGEPFLFYPPFSLLVYFDVSIPFIGLNSRHLLKVGTHLDIKRFKKFSIGLL